MFKLLYNDLTQFFMNLIKWIAELIQKEPIIFLNPSRPVFNYQLFISVILMMDIANSVFVSQLSVKML